MKSSNIFPRYIMTSLNSSGLIQIVLFLCCTHIKRNMRILHVWNFRKMYLSMFCFAYGAKFCYWTRNRWQKCSYRLKSFYSKLLNNSTYEVGIICFSPEYVICSNVKRANNCWKCPSLFSFWITTSQRIFGGELSALFLILVNYLS